jgi:hypothetical protein
VRIRASSETVETIDKEVMQKAHVRAPKCINKLYALREP